jgi:hypothetical protein
MNASSIRDADVHRWRRADGTSRRVIEWMRIGVEHVICPRLTACIIGSLNGSAGVAHPRRRGTHPQFERALLDTYEPERIAFAPGLVSTTSRRGLSGANRRRGGGPVTCMFLRCATWSDLTQFAQRRIDSRHIRNEVDAQESPRAILPMSWEICRQRSVVQNTTSPFRSAVTRWRIARHSGHHVDG